MSDLAPSPSRALRVTFFEDRAEVLRRAEVTVVPGAQWVAVAGVTPYVDDRSLTARALGEAARVLAARVRRRVHQDPAAGREEIERREAEARAAGQRLEAARREAARAQAREGRAAQLLAQWMAAMGAVPRFFADPARADEWTDAYRTLDDAVRAAHAAVATARAALTRAGDEKRRADQRLAEGRVAQPRHETVVEVQLEARAGATVPVEIGYRTPCALWRPEHLARLADGKIELVTSAAAWQRTGEDWDGVTAVFSTARTARHATPPVVGDDVLRLRRRSDEDKKHVVVEARDQVVAAAGLDRGTRAVDEMPGVDDGGEPLAFAPAAKVSIPSDGRPLRVEVARARVTGPARSGAPWASVAVARRCATGARSG